MRMHDGARGMAWNEAPRACRGDVCDAQAFARGVKWSPDGRKLLVACEGCTYRLYAWTETDEPACWKPQRHVREAGYTYDWKWRPKADGDEATSECFASASRGVPVHLWNAEDASLLGAYRVYDQHDELLAAHAVAFGADGSRLHCGCVSSVATFCVERPGRDYSVMRTDEAQGKEQGLRGIVSCLDVDRTYGDMLAVGSFHRRVAVYDLASNQAVLLLEGHRCGVTQVQFSACGNFLYTAARKEDCILCWDVRYTMKEVYQMDRSHNQTNQRIQFDIEPSGRRMAVGNTLGELTLYDLRDGRKLSTQKMSCTTLNAVHYHSQEPLLAMSTGCRPGFAQAGDESDTDSDSPRRDTDSQTKLTSPYMSVPSAVCVWTCDYKHLDRND